jgi:hypothetical protein
MNSINFTLIRIVACGVVILFSVLTVQAQFTAGIQGTVTDSTGGLVPDVKITLTNTATGQAQTTTANNEGFYRITGLSPGSYTLAAEKDGFKKQLFENVEINAEATQGFDILLTTGEIAETVTITEATAQALETENGNVSRAITTREIQQLPQVGRDPYELLRLTPGVFGDGARSSGGAAVNLPNTQSGIGERSSRAVIKLFSRGRPKFGGASQSCLTEWHKRFSRFRVSQIQFTEAECF